MALADARALGDPLVGGVDDLGQVVVGHDPVRQIAADAGHNATQGTSRNGAHPPVGMQAGSRRGAAAELPSYSVRSLRRTRFGARSAATGMRLGEAAGRRRRRGTSPPRRSGPAAGRRSPATGRCRPCNFFSAGRASSAPSLGQRRRRSGPSRSSAPMNRAVPSAVFSADVAGEAVGDHHVDRALGDVVALDEAPVVEVERRLAAAAWASRTSSWPFMSSEPTFSRPTVGRGSPRRARRVEGLAHDGELDQLRGVAGRRWRRRPARR